jgi:hypothetical protein
MPGGTSYSINPRSNSDGYLFFGGNNPAIRDLTQLFLDHPGLESDDRIGGYKPVTQAVIQLAENEFEGWGKFDEMAPGEGIGSDWTGIIGGLLLQSLLSSHDEIDPRAHRRARCQA